MGPVTIFVGGLTAAGDRRGCGEWLAGASAAALGAVRGRRTPSARGDALLSHAITASPAGRSVGPPAAGLYRKRRRPAAGWRRTHPGDRVGPERRGSTAAELRRAARLHMPDLVPVTTQPPLLCLEP